MRPTADQHPSDSDLAAFALGKLDRSTIEWVGGHLAECSTCRSVVEDTPTDSLVKLLRGANAGGTRRPGDTGPWVAGTDTGGAFSPPPAPPINPDDVPQALRDHPKYHILRKLGEGGMGVVYQAEHKMMGRLVAIKVMNRIFVGNPEAVDRFNREIKAAAKLNHPNIAQAYDADQVDDLQLLIMEYVEGQDLAAYLKAKGPLPIAHACYYVRQAALGLQHAHEHGLVHRDLKPQNLMRMPKGAVKILDFGLAKLLTDPSAGRGLTRDRTTMGTPAFIAPEQALDTKSADIRADIYSLGCTLFSLLTGRPPFIGDNETEVVIAHIQNAPPELESLRPEASPELSALVARMLAKKPDDRPQTPKDVAEALTPFVKAGAKAAPAKTSIDRPPPGPRRWSLVLTAIAAALLVGAVLAGILLTFKTKDGVVTLQVDPPDAEVVAEEGKIIVTRTGDTAPYTITVVKGGGKVLISKAGFQVESKEVTLTDDGRTLTVSLRPSLEPARVSSTVKAALELIRFSAHEQRVTCVAFTPDGKSVLSGSNDNHDSEPDAKGQRFFVGGAGSTLRLWNAATGEQIACNALRPTLWNNYAFHKLAISPDGRYALTFRTDPRNGDRPGPTVELWRLPDLKLMKWFPENTKGTFQVGFTADSRRALAGTREGALWVWGTNPPEVIGQHPARDLKLTALAFSPDGRSALQCHADGSLSLIDPETGKDKAAWSTHEFGASVAAFGADGRTAVTGGIDKKVRIWDVATGQVKAVLRGHAEVVTAIALSADGSRALSGGADRTVRLWDVTTGMELARASGHTGNVTGVALSPDGRRIATSSLDKTARIWTVPE